MTDEQIRKALKCCLSDKPPCMTCKYDAESITVDECMGKLMEDALDLINRQKAEIEKLTIDLKAMRGAANSYKAEIKRITEPVKLEHNSLCETETYMGE